MYQPPPPPKASSSTKGCLIAIAVLFGVFALCTCTGIGLMSWGIYSNPEARRAIGATGDMIGLMQDAMSDPGAVAMVDAGCQQAMAFPLARLLEIMREVDPENISEPGPDAPELVVSCSLQDTAQSCDALARVFVSAHTPAPRSFALVVQTYPSAHQLCANLYGPSGELLRPLSMDEQYNLPVAPGQPPAVTPPAPAPSAPTPPSDPAAPAAPTEPK